MAKAQILCIEDSKEFQIYLSAALKEYTMVFAGNLNEALRIVESKRGNFDLILLDVSLPDGNGLKILPRLKEVLAPRFVPVIIISADEDVVTKVAAFGVGADDYVGKPTDINELRARIEARLRTAKVLEGEKSNVVYGDLSMDLDKMIVEVASDVSRESIELTPFEFKILKLLISRPGQVYSREVIIDRVWGLDKYITTRTVDAHISHLRKKIANSQVSVETVLSTGYKLALKDKTEATEK